MYVTILDELYIRHEGITLTEEKKSNLKLVDFQEKVKESKKVPEFLIEKLELLLKSAKEGTLKAAIIHFDFEKEDQKLDGATLFWDQNEDPIRLLGLTDLIHDAAREHAIMEIYDVEPEDE